MGITTLQGERCEPEERGSQEVKVLLDVPEDALTDRAEPLTCLTCE